MFPAENGAEEALFRVASDNAVPAAWVLLHVTMDVKRNRLSVGFTERHSNAVKVFVILDCESGLSMALNTGLTYVSILNWKNDPSLIYAQSSALSTIDAHFSDDGKLLHVFSSYACTEPRWESVSFAMSDIELYATPGIKVSNEQVFDVHPVARTSVGMAKHAAITDDTLVNGGHILSQWWPLFLDVSVRLTCIFIMRAAQSWLAVHYYATADGPITNRRCAFKMMNPVLGKNGSPLMALEYEHMLWIDQITISSGLKRILRLATYAEPETDIPLDETDDLSPTIVTLPVPQDVLNETYHLSLNVSLGSIVMATEDRFHTFHYV